MKLRLAFAPLLLTFGMAVHGAPAAAQGADAEFDAKMDKYLGSEKGRMALGKAMETYVQESQQRQAEAEMEEMFKNPVKVDVGQSPVKGPADAKVTVIEFSDFECPYCKRGADTVEQILKAYPKEVKVAFKHLPLPFHKNAMPAAKASIAAQKQGKFWEFHDVLFNNQKSLGQDFFEKTAANLKLDVEKFKKDMNDPETEKQVKADMELAQKHGIQGTPGFFVNGVAVKGAYPFDHFKKIIDKHLGSAGK